METERVDQLLRSMSLRASRRGIITGLTGGFVAMLPLALRLDATEAKNKKKGKRKKKSKSKQQDAPSQTPTSDPTPLPPPPLNPCEGQPDFTDCGNGMECSGGACAANPQCNVGNCFGQPLPCCSGVVCQSTCPLSDLGQMCVSTDDCAAGACVGFICQ